MAESSLTFSSILSKYAPVHTVTLPESISRPDPLPVTKKPLPHSKTRMRQDISYPFSATPKINHRSSSPLIGTVRLPFDENPFGAETGKKTRFDSLHGSRPKAETDHERQARRKLLLEKMKLKKEAAMSRCVTRVSGTPPMRIQQPGNSVMTKSSYPNSTYRASASVSVASDMKKMSYKEKLVMAAKLQEEKRNLGVITHKARAPVVQRKEWQKQLEARKQTEGTTGLTANSKSKSLGNLFSGERGGTSAAKKLPMKQTGNTLQARKVAHEDGRRFLTGNVRSMDKSRSGDIPTKRKRSPSPISWRGRNSTAPTIKKANIRRPGRSRYDDAEEDDDDWIVDDDDDDGPRGRGYGKHYRYAESNYESDSDMEAAGLDILEEEEHSHRKAIREDMEQEKLEKQLAAKKAALKKKTGTQ
ncbi:hypothetical protein K440DRAFT_660459 [Wilcoxina mikolae CBS 423.85]|nr:hypothetical protein K440DRAFT_660459 [Wilcoxina mikolae CBS 423.85]